MPYIPALDGIRAIAVFLVFLFHSRVPGFFGGYLGVDVFFVLSGFLITSLLLREIDISGSVQILRFYKKRMMRLMPPLLCVLALYLCLAPLVWPDHGRHGFDALIAAAYLTDTRLADTALSLRYTWSLSVEQHYYLLWPLILLPLVRVQPNRLIHWLAALYVAATLWRVYCALSGYQWNAIYYHFDTRLSGLLFGSLLAARLRNQPGTVAPSLAWAIPTAGCIAFVGWFNSLGLVAGIVFAELATGATIAAIMQPGRQRLRHLLSVPLLVYVGKLSYGIYLFHYPIVYYVREHFPPLETLAISIPLSLMLAALSYHTIEARSRKPSPQPAAQQSALTPP